MSFDLSTLFSNAPVGLVLCSPENDKIVMANDAFADLIGRSVSELQGMSRHELTDDKYAPIDIRSLAALKRSHEYGPVEIELVRGDGRLVHVEMQLRQLEVDGKQLVLSAVRPTNELGGDRFHTFFLEFGIGLCVSNMAGQLVAVNQRYADIIGRSISETLKLSYWNITPKWCFGVDYEEKEKELLESCLTTGEYGPYDKFYSHRNGDLVPVRLYLRHHVVRGTGYLSASVEVREDQDPIIAGEVNWEPIKQV